MTDFSNFESIKSSVNRKAAALESARKAYLYVFVFFSAGLLFTETALHGGWNSMVPITAIGAVFGMFMNIKTGDRISSLKREIEQLQNGYERKDEKQYSLAAEMVSYLTKGKMAGAFLLCSTITFAALMLAGCAHVNETYDDKGNPAYDIQCGMLVRGTCYDEAKKLCPAGYKLLTKTESWNPWGGSGSVITIRCK